MACSEFSLIENYFNSRTTARADVILGIGDDAAVMQLAENEQLVVTTDTMVAGVHFPENTSAYDIGYKLMAVNISDLAAMGAQPRWASLALTLPDVDEDWLEEFSAGMFSLANKHKVQLVGGDTTRGPLTLSLTLQGVVSSGRCLQRAGAGAGDMIYVSGRLGDAGLALKQIHAGVEVDNSALARLNRPTPRVELGQALQGIASAAIDISDGLLADLGHILKASGVGAHLQLDDLPMSAAMRDAVSDGDWSLPLAAGDDYELCFTVPAANTAALEACVSTLGLEVTRVGMIEPETGLRCFTLDGELVTLHGRGYEHFSAISVDEVDA